MIRYFVTVFDNGKVYDIPGVTKDDESTWIRHISKLKSGWIPMKELIA